MDKIKKRALEGLENVVFRLVGRRSRWKQWYVERKDEALGREMVGRDKFGNKYYQYYSFHGLPTRRVVLYQFFDTNKFNIDPHFLGWLHRRELLPPTPEELEKLYLEHDIFRENALNWDKEQLRMIKEFKDKKKELDEKYQRETYQIEEGKDFEPLEWDRKKREPLKSSDLQFDRRLTDMEMGQDVLSALDQMELDYFEEYDLVMQKELKKGQEVGRVIQEEAMKAKYFFEYLRTHEKLYQYEQEREARKKEERFSVPEELQPITESREKKEALEQSEGFREFEKKKAEMKEEFQSQRYNQFKEEYKDIYEHILDKRKDQV